jgi:hypothetical protein
MNGTWVIPSDYNETQVRNLLRAEEILLFLGECEREGPVLLEV